ncbi:MAG: hypothetical protein ACI81O_000243 [Cyclobacteriaceae bacterium]|jgi:hypothetical protein
MKGEPHPFTFRVNVAYNLLITLAVSYGSTPTFISGTNMSYGDNNHEETNNHEPSSEDSFADAMSAVVLICIAVAAMVYWVSNQ